MRLRQQIDPAKRAWWSMHIEAWLPSQLSRQAYCEAQASLDEATGAGSLAAQDQTPLAQRHSPYARAGRRKAVQAFWAMHVEAMHWSGCSASAYRQSKIFARYGVDIERSTLSDWVGGAAWWLEALHRRLANHVMANHLFADDTPMPVLDPGRRRTKTGRLWAYVRDGRCGMSRSARGSLYLRA